MFALFIEPEVRLQELGTLNRQDLGSESDRT